MKKLIAIWDNDLGQYHSELKTPKKTFRNFLWYRDDEGLGEWWVSNEYCAPKFHKKYHEKFMKMSEKEFEDNYDEIYELFDEWVKEIPTTKIGRKYVIEDIYACNFEIRTYKAEIVKIKVPTIYENESGFDERVAVVLNVYDDKGKEFIEQGTDFKIFYNEYEAEQYAAEFNYAQKNK
jgi:hypothetical protein